ncbi:hypothetical protein [Streptomyces lycii]|uniref:Integral membrane protein n=1 Tax=Streptomyces lycii TaxID=2654337 RepID=A0ABQ7FHG2_9ACTN|nr:hypothetical protein [Streptomyces lycii]KAF4406688.1 hypothetical protein GCU69_23670 [Streptomyces lycii]
MVRRPVALVAAVVLAAEAVGFALLNWFLGEVVDNQRMSLAGLDPDAMSLGSVALGVVFGLYLLTCAVVLLVAGVRDRAPGRFSRVLLIVCAVVHAVLGAVTVGLVGWAAFAFLMLVLGLVVLALIGYGTDRGTAESGAGEPSGSAPRTAPGAGPA